MTKEEILFDLRNIAADAKALATAIDRSYSVKDACQKYGDSMQALSGAMSRNAKAVSQVIHDIMRTL
jgi:hypothetical protein